MSCEIISVDGTKVQNFAKLSLYTWLGYIFQLARSLLHKIFSAAFDNPELSTISLEPLARADSGIFSLNCARKPCRGRKKKKYFENWISMERIKTGTITRRPDVGESAQR